MFSKIFLDYKEEKMKISKDKKYLRFLPFKLNHEY